jgi:hypothetical protein
VQSEIQENQLELSENVILSAQAYFDGKTNRLKVNFKNEGKGTARSTNVQYRLRTKQTNSSFEDTFTLQSLGPGSTAEKEIIPAKDVATLLDTFDLLSISWQGTRADSREFTGSLATIKLSQIETIGRITRFQ